MASVASATSAARSKGYPQPKKGIQRSKNIPKAANNNRPLPANDNQPRPKGRAIVRGRITLPGLIGGGLSLDAGSLLGEHIAIVGEALAAGWVHPNFSQAGQCASLPAVDFTNGPIFSGPAGTACSRVQRAAATSYPSNPDGYPFSDFGAPSTLGYREWFYRNTSSTFRHFEPDGWYLPDFPGAVPNPHFQPAQSPRAIPASAGGAGRPPIGESPVETSSSSNGLPRRRGDPTRLRKKPSGKKRPKEVKVKGGKTKAARAAQRLIKAAGGAFNLATETKDVVDILIQALPKHLRPKNGGLHTNIEAVLANLGQIDWEKAVPALVANEIEDQIAGRVAGARNKAGTGLVKGPVLRGPGVTPQLRQPNIRW